MSTVTCPDCDERVTLKPGRSSVKCPACGSSIKADAPAAKGRRRKDDDDDEDEDRREKAEKKKPKRKYREEWDDDDDDDERKPPPKPKGSLTWLWVTLTIVLVVLAGCGGAGWWLFTTIRKTRDNLDQQAQQWRDEQQQRMNAQPGNPQGRPKPPPPQNAAFYPKRKPFDVDPQLLAKPSPVYLSDLQPFDVKQGDWPVGLNGALGYDDRWVCVNGQYYDHGIGLIPPNNGVARMSFATGGAARRLKGQVALNDFWHDNDAWNEVTFAIYKDGKEVWRSDPLKKKKTPLPFDVDVTGARVVMIETNAPKSAHDAHCVWLDPVLEK